MDRSKKSSSSSSARNESMTQDEEDMLTDEQFAALYEGLPQIPAEEGFGRNWRRFCATLASGSQRFFDAIWVARNLDKSDTCFALASQGYDPKRIDIEGAHSAVQASTRFISSVEGQRAKTLREMACDISWAASTALQAELQNLMLQENVEGDNGAGCGSILTVLLSIDGGRTLEHRSKITSLMAIIYASQIIQFHSASEYGGGPRYIASEVSRLLGREAAANYSQIVTTDNDKRYINVMYGWLFALIFDRDPLNERSQDITPFPTNMWAISYLALRFSSQDFRDYGHTLQTEMGRALKISSRTELTDALTRFFAVYNRDGRRAGSYSKEEITALVATFPNDPFPLSEINMGHWMIELSDEIKINRAQLPVSNLERQRELDRSANTETTFLGSRVGKPVASMDSTLDPHRDSIVNPGEMVHDDPVGSSQNPDMFTDEGNIPEQRDIDARFEREDTTVNNPKWRKFKPRSGRFLEIQENANPYFHQSLNFGDRGRVSEARAEISSASNSRPSQTSQNTLSKYSPPIIPYAPPYQKQMSTSSSSAAPPIPSITIGQRVQATVKNMSNSNTEKTTITGTVVHVGQKMNKSGKLVNVVGICLDTQYITLYGIHDCDGQCSVPKSGIYVPIDNVKPEESSFKEGNLLDLDVGGRRRRKTRKTKKTKRTRKTKKVMKKAKKSKKSRRSRK